MDEPDKMQKMTGAQAIIASLEAEGVKHVFGYPGAQVLDIYDALYASKKIHHTLFRHEQGATHAADGYTRSTGKPGVVLVTSGPGATNTVTGIATAYMDSVPLIVITGQVDTAAIGTDAFQESDITGITLPIVKHSYLVKDASELPYTVKEAFHIATTGRRGPVLIDVPSDVARTIIDFKYPESIEMQSYKPTIKGNSRQIKQAVGLIGKARQPVIYAGAGIIASGAEALLATFASCMQIPVATTLMGKGCFDESDALSLGMPGIHGARFTNHAVCESDLIIAVGARFAERVTGNLERFAQDAKVIHIDIDPAEIGKNRVATVPIVGDAKAILASLVSEVKKAKLAPQTEAWLARIDAWRKEFPPPRCSIEDAIDPTQVMQAIDRLIAKRDVIVTTEVGQHQIWASQYIHAISSRTFFCSGGLGTMGFGFPAAIGAQIGNPNSLVICLAGDGSIQMNSQEMATAAINKLPVKVIIFNNGSLGMVRQHQQLFYGGRYSASILAQNPDFLKLADAYSWGAERISKPDEVDAALERLFDGDGPALLDIIIPMEALTLPMVRPGEAIDSVCADVPPMGSVPQKGE